MQDEQNIDQGRPTIKNESRQFVPVLSVYYCIGPLHLCKPSSAFCIVKEAGWEGWGQLALGAEVQRPFFFACKNLGEESRIAYYLPPTTYYPPPLCLYPVSLYILVGL